MGCRCAAFILNFLSDLSDILIFECPFFFPPLFSSSFVVVVAYKIFKKRNEEAKNRSTKESRAPPRPLR